MLITNINGKPVNLVSPGTIAHTIDDDANNEIKEGALLVLEEPGTIKVTLLNRAVETLNYYDNYPACYVTKVWATGTTIDHSKIKLWE